jgi:hypothetical protein
MNGQLRARARWLQGKGRKKIASVSDRWYIRPQPRGKVEILNHKGMKVTFSKAKVAKVD